MGLWVRLKLDLNSELITFFKILRTYCDFISFSVHQRWLPFIYFAVTVTLDKKCIKSWILQRTRFGVFNNYPFYNLSDFLGIVLPVDSSISTSKSTLSDSLPASTSTSQFPENVHSKESTLLECLILILFCLILEIMCVILHPLTYKIFVHVFYRKLTGKRP